MYDPAMGSTGVRAYLLFQRETAIYLCAMQQCALAFSHWAWGVTGIRNLQR